MIRKTLFAIFGVGLLLGLAAIAPRARADEWDQATRLTFSQTVQLPDNHVLPAGTYWFEVMPESSQSSDVVQIANEDHSKLYGTYLTIPVHRAKATSSVELQFAEPSGGQPAALMTWFYPGTLEGHDFVYAPSEEAKLSASTQITVNARNISEE
jgi:hypothetical protein